MLIIVCYQLCISKWKPNFSNRIYIIFEHIMMHTKHKKHIFHNLLYISTLLSVPQCIPYKECLVVHLFITPHNGRYSCPAFHEVSVADRVQHTSTIPAIPIHFKSVLSRFYLTYSLRFYGLLGFEVSRFSIFDWWTWAGDPLSK